MITIEDLPNGLMPKEITDAFQEYLKIQGRVKFPLGPTSPSAVSSSASDDTGDIKNINDEISDLVNSVDALEELVEQLEDLNDQLLKDMNIPSPNDSITKAIKQLGGENSITKDIFDKALDIIAHAPILTYGYDPVLGALTGNGSLEGPWIQCSDITGNISDKFKVVTNDATLKNQTIEISNKFDQNLAQQMLHILLMLWWNMLWPKFIVDLVIIDPIKLMVAKPIDGLIGFFQKPKFRIKGPNWIDKNGVISKAITKFRVFLLCKIPYKLWSSAKTDYDPVVKIYDTNGNILNCSGEESCIEDTSNYDNEGSIPSSAKKDSGLSGLETIIEEQIKDQCGSPNNYGQNASKDEPNKLGISNKCLDAAKKIIDTVEAITYQPNLRK